MKYLFFFPLLILTSCADQNTLQSKTPPTPSTTDSVFTVHYSFSDLIHDARLFSASDTICLLNDVRLAEVSGIAASRANAGMFYVEEDSGNPNQIQMIDHACSVVATFVLYGQGNRDWEDIAVAPGPLTDLSYVYVADIGDNYSLYKTKYIYRFAEPMLSGKTFPVIDTVRQMDVIQLQLPDGNFNAEAFMVDPISKDFFLVTKENSAGVYTAPYPQDLLKPIVMKKIGVLPFSKITAGDISPDGKEILLKTETYICYWKKIGSESIAELLKKTPVLVPYTIEQQGEGICFTADNSGYITVSERPDPSLDQPLFLYKRK